MGKTEKIVVLSVLFVVVVLFVWSIQGDGTQAKSPDGSENNSSTDTNEGGRTVPRGGSPTDDTVESDPAGPILSPRGAENTEVAGAERIELLRPSGLLSAGIGEGGVERPADAPEIEAPAGPRPVRMQPGWDLVTTAGLESTVDPTVLVMHPAEGATWESLARDLYGDESKGLLLRHNNEGMTEPTDLIFVPVKDELGDAGGDRIVEVLEGESLWGVATRTLGKGSRWREIFEANRDVLTDADFVAPGTRLRIPGER